jgi:hypothetical protein
MPRLHDFPGKLPDKPEFTVLGNDPNGEKAKANGEAAWPLIKERMERLPPTFPDQVKHALLSAELTFRTKPTANHVPPFLVVDGGRIVALPEHAGPVRAGSLLDVALEHGAEREAYRFFISDDGHLVVLFVAAGGSCPPVLYSMQAEILPAGAERTLGSWTIAELEAVEGE